MANQTITTDEAITAAIISGAEAAVQENIQIQEDLIRNTHEITNHPEGAIGLFESQLNTAIESGEFGEEEDY